MSQLTDFRASARFSPKRIKKSGSGIGKTIYPRLYTVENLLRILIHSTLSAQLGQTWWQIAVDPRVQKKISGFQSMYARRPWHTNPGKHEIYYMDLFDLIELLRVNGHIISIIVVDIDQWVAKLESIRLPRNVVAHMNFLSAKDRSRIDTLHSDLMVLFQTIEKSKTLSLQIP